MAFLFKKARELIDLRDAAIISAINQSGYIADTFEDAGEIVDDFEKEYLRARGRNGG